MSEDVYRMALEEIMGQLAEALGGQQHDMSWIRPRTLRDQERHSRVEQSYYLARQVLGYPDQPSISTSPTTTKSEG